METLTVAVVAAFLGLVGGVAVVVVYHLLISPKLPPMVPKQELIETPEVREFLERCLKDPGFVPLFVRRRGEALGQFRLSRAHRRVLLKASLHWFRELLQLYEAEKGEHHL